MKTVLSMPLCFLFLCIVSFLSGCSSLAGAPPTPLPTLVLDKPVPDLEVTWEGSPKTGSGVIASGMIIPRQEARLVVAIAGKIEAINVELGDHVKTGQTLAQLEGQEKLGAAVSTAELELEQARQALVDLQEESETMRIRAMQDVITFERAVRDAQFALDNFTIPSTQAALDTVEAIGVMKDRLDKARAEFELYKYHPSTDPTRKDRIEALNEAQADYNAAVKRLQYEYNVEVAEIQLARAQRDYAVYKTGPNPAQDRLAQARLTNAQTQLSAAHAALANLLLTAPFDGTISRIDIHTGEWVVPGQVILALADLDSLRVKTTDLSERDIPFVRVGQAVTVLIKALEVTVAGKVVDIAPTADLLGGDVVYQTIINLDSQPEGLRAGMSVTVRF